MQDPIPTDPLVDDPGPRAGQRRQIGLLLFDGVEELDAVGPWEVLSHWTQEHPEDGWDVFCLSRRRCARRRRQDPRARRAPLDRRRPSRSTYSSTRAVPAPGRCSATRTTWTGSASSGHRSR